MPSYPPTPHLHPLRNKWYKSHEASFTGMIPHVHKLLHANMLSTLEDSNETGIFQHGKSVSFYQYHFYPQSQGIWPKWTLETHFSTPIRLNINYFSLLDSYVIMQSIACLLVANSSMYHFETLRDSSWHGVGVFTSWEIVPPLCIYYASHTLCPVLYLTSFQPLFPL